MEFRQLKHFLAVAEESSFTRAAARLYVAQSTLSASVLALERELGAELFVRGRAGAELTDAGLALLEPAHKVIDEADRARGVVAEVQEHRQTPLSIATAVVPGPLDVVHAIRRLRKCQPDLRVHVSRYGMQELLRPVVDGRVDFAITPLTHPVPPALRSESLFRTPLVAVCPIGHPLAGRRGIDPSELAEELIIDLPPDWPIRKMVDDLFAARGIRRTIRCEATEWHGALLIAIQVKGVTYGPLACLDSVHPDIGHATFANAPLLDFALVTRDDVLQRATARAFLRTYRCQAGGGKGRGPE